MSLYDSYSSNAIITAEATPPGRGGISIIRVSGAGSTVLVGRLFDRQMPASGQHKFGKLHKITTDSTEIIDEVVVLSYAADRSYTGEEVVEISTHGSPLIVTEALECLYRLGARPAKPGEFTLRAFINGRITLTQAEAVADLIAARSLEAARQAQKQLQGSLKQVVHSVGDEILRLLSLYELELDFVEDDVELAPTKDKLNILEKALGMLEAMLEGYQTNRRLRTGVHVTLRGAPNVGKSSLFNALLNVDRAIVHESPGTTRDTIDGSCNIGGIMFDLHDTAGIRDSDDGVEMEGVERSRHNARIADILIDIRSVDLPDKSGDSPSHAVRLSVINKIDLGIPEIGADELTVSVRTGQGIDDLKARLYHIATEGITPTENTISRERHYSAVIRAHDALLRARTEIERNFTGETIAEHLREALAEMDVISGKSRLTGLLDDIFAKFCIGK